MDDMKWILNNLRHNYRNMVNRCHNKEHKSYKYYGARGIAVCELWRQNRAYFITWALKHGYKRGLLLHRKDNNKGYSPDNCIYVSRKKHLRLHASY